MYQFISIEGPDATGKTTLIQRLLKDEDLQPIKTVERHSIDSHPDAIQPWWVDVSNPQVKLFLYFAEHVHLNNQCRSWIQRGYNVVMDRGPFSLLAYGELFERYSDAEENVVRAFLSLLTMPEIVIYLKVPPHVIEERLRKQREHRIGIYEQQAEENITLWKKLHFLYRDWFLCLGQNVVYIDGNQPVDEVYQQVKEEILG